MNLPTKPIERATVYFAGERAAGITGHSFDLELFIDLNDLDDGLRMEHLEKIRFKIDTLYKLITGENPTWVKFDFECD